MTDTHRSPEDFPFILELPVQWGEMDAAGHVNNLIYLRWFESARIEYFVRLGQDVIETTDGGPGLILASQDCKYLFPVTYPDTIRLGVTVRHIGTDRFTMHCKMWSRRHDRLVAIANGVLVTYDYGQRKKAPIPEDMKRRVAEFEQHP